MARADDASMRKMILKANSKIFLEKDYSVKAV